jgi:hypothetical protein
MKKINFFLLACSIIIIFSCASPQAKWAPILLEQAEDKSQFVHQQKITGVKVREAKIILEEANGFLKSGEDEKAYYSAKLANSLFYLAITNQKNDSSQKSIQASKNQLELADKKAADLEGIYKTLKGAK